MPKFDTNAEFVENLMNFSPHGGLCQAFIIEAIRYYAEKVAATPEPTEHGNGLISAIAWHKIAKDILERMEQKYEKTPSTK
jgi:hypothetical protein